jgi:phosphate transport system substrate-binding protein
MVKDRMASGHVRSIASGTQSTSSTKEIHVRRSIAIIAGMAIAASTVAFASPASANQTIPGGGASFPQPFLAACLADFNASQSNFTISYQSTGSGRGKTNFANGQFVYGQSDSAYSGGEPTFGWEYVPNIGGAIAFPINLTNTKTGKSLGSSIQFTQKTLAKVMGGAITKWRDPAILKENPRIAAGIPDQNITVVYRSDASGTSNNALQYLNAWAPTIFAKVQDDFGTAFPGGKPLANSLSGNRNPGVLSAVAATAGAIGYVDLGDAKGYPSARVQNANGEFVAPSSASAAKNLANQTNIDAQGLVKLDYNLKAPGAYPVSIFSYALVRTDGKGPNGLGVRQFQDYVLAKCGPSKAASLGYVPVAGKVLAKARELVQQIK